ncbi:MAG: hypothetical protein K8R21_13305, partial [Leptospira sp.]|nr:hypothetical protein [Leptospira sp.]
MILLNLFKTCFLKRDILVSFIKRDFYSKFAGSFLGMAWSYIIPAVQITTFYFIFGVMMGSRLNIQSDQGNYSTWLISGMLPWFYFSEIIYFGSNSLIRNSNLIKKTLFPSEILNISVIGS